MYVYIYIYMYTFIHLCTYMDMHVHMNACVDDAAFFVPNGRTNKPIQGVGHIFGFVFSWIKNGGDLGVARSKAGLPSLPSSTGCSL